jgi:hypothetical protein
MKNKTIISKTVISDTNPSVKKLYQDFVTEHKGNSIKALNSYLLYIKENKK